MPLPSVDHLGVLFDWLRDHRLCWLYIPVSRTSVLDAPQVLIFDTPGFASLRHVGTAVMFRHQPSANGPHWVSRSQAYWVGELLERGWEVLVCRNARSAINELRSMGYGEGYLA